MKRPVNKPYRITLGFRATSSPYNSSNPHNGVDYVSDDRKILATHDGIVSFAGWANDRSGNMVAIEGGGYRVSFSHIKNGGFKVAKGEKVKAGQHIADMGSTGFSTGIHAHVVANGGALDIEKLIKEDDMKIDRSLSIWLWRIGKLTHNPTKKQIDSLIGKDPTDVLDDWSNDGDFIERKDIIRNRYPNALKEIEELKKNGTKLTKGKYYVE